VAADWPTVTDVELLLRIGANPDDDQVVATDLAAAIAWVSGRCSPQYVDPDDPATEFLPDPLWTVTQHEAARLYRRRDSVDGTVGWGDMGIVRIGPKDPDIETMIAQYLALVVG
jgi:hypothetical protein